MKKLLIGLLFLAGSLWAQDTSNTINMITVYSAIRPLPIENSNSVFVDATTVQGGKSIGYILNFDKEVIDSLLLVIRVTTNQSGTYRVEMRNRDSSVVVPITFTGLVDTAYQSPWVYVHKATVDTLKLYGKANNATGDIFLYFVGLVKLSKVKGTVTATTVYYDSTAHDSLAVHRTDINGKIAKADTSTWSATKTWVLLQTAVKAPAASPTFTGTVTLPTGLSGTLRAASGVVSATASDTVGLAASLADKASLLHYHVGTDITSGTVAAARLPLASAASSGIIPAGGAYPNKFIGTDGSGNVGYRSAPSGWDTVGLAYTKYRIDSLAAAGIGSIFQWYFAGTAYGDSLALYAGSGISISRVSHSLTFSATPWDTTAGLAYVKSLIGSITIPDSDKVGVTIADGEILAKGDSSIVSRADSMMRRQAFRDSVALYGVKLGPRTAGYLARVVSSDSIEFRAVNTYADNAAALAAGEPPGWIYANSSTGAMYMVLNDETVIRFDSRDSINYDNHTSPHTLGTVIGSGVNEYSIVGIYGIQIGDGVDVDSVKVDSLSGGALVLCDSLAAYSEWSTETALYGKKGLSAGAHTFTAYTHQTTAFYGMMGVLNLFGVNQTTPIGTRVVAHATGTAVTLNITNGSGNWVVDIVGNGGARTFTPTSPQIKFISNMTNADSDVASMSYKSDVGTTSAWTMGTSGAWRQVAIVVNKP